jgi:hypothetical protein
VVLYYLRPLQVKTHSLVDLLPQLPSTYEVQVGQTDDPLVALLQLRGDTKPVHVVRCRQLCGQPLETCVSTPTSGYYPIVTLAPLLLPVICPYTRSTVARSCRLNRLNMYLLETSAPHNNQSIFPRR